MKMVSQRGMILRARLTGSLTFQELIPQNKPRGSIGMMTILVNTLFRTNLTVAYVELKALTDPGTKNGSAPVDAESTFATSAGKVIVALELLRTPYV